MTGLPLPNTFPCPDEMVDYWMARLSNPALRVLLYIVRRTLGFYKERDPISYRQFLEGIVTREGKRLDSGTGLSRSSLRKALDELESLGLISVDRRENEAGDADVSTYSVVWRDVTRRFADGGRAQNIPRSTRIAPQKGPKTSEGRARIRPQVGRGSDSQETVLQETDEEIPVDAFEQIVKRAAIGLNRWPRRADVAKELALLVSRTAAAPSELSLAVDRALAVRQKGDSADVFYSEVLRHLEIAAS